MAVIYFENVDKTKTKRKIALKRKAFKAALIISIGLNIIQAALLIYILSR